MAAAAPKVLVGLARYKSLLDANRSNFNGQLRDKLLESCCASRVGILIDLDACFDKIDDRHRQFIGRVRDLEEMFALRFQKNNG